MTTVIDLVLLLGAGAAGVGVGVVATRWWWVARERRAAAPARGNGSPVSADPAARAARAAQAVARPAARPTVLPVPPWAADILVVDDSAVARTKLRRLLERHGYTVDLAEDGVQALERLARGRYGLMISDLEMPNMDGIELIHACRARPATARMPVIAVSGHEGLRAKFEACGDVCGVHRKPWVDDVLASHVAALVGLRTPRPLAPAEREDAPAA